MKERPIIFSGPMVRAILEGRKTQTRRVLTQQPIARIDGLYYTGRDLRTGRGIWITRIAGHPEPGFRIGNHSLSGEIACPYGAPGSRLWVRETFCDNGGGEIEYRATSYSVDGQWSPSIHMPRRASRIDLEVTGIRVERLQEISEEDARAEGVERSQSVELVDGSPCYTLPFQGLWEQIHGIDNPKAWASNPWVWVVEFQRVTA